MSDPITVRNPLWIKTLILAGLPACRPSPPAASACACFPGGAASPCRSLGAFSLVVAVKGWPLVRFVNHTATLHADGLIIRKGDQSNDFGWEQLGAIEASDTF